MTSSHHYSGPSDVILLRTLTFCIRLCQVVSSFLPPLFPPPPPPPPPPDLPEFFCPLLGLASEGGAEGYVSVCVIQQYSEWREAVVSETIKTWRRRMRRRRWGYLWPLQRWMVSSYPLGSTSQTLRQEETQHYLSREYNVDSCSHGKSHGAGRQTDRQVLVKPPPVVPGSYLSEVWRSIVSQLLIPPLARCLPPPRSGSQRD